jgi:2-polyprenyl-3-methyl-5-hydroxy-6-metoxy-1,4-benzoquinol methylase
MASGASAHSEPNPVIIWETINAFQRTAALKAAEEIDLFTAIGEGADTVEAICERCQASSRGVRILCDYMAVIGLILKEDGKYRLTPTSAVFLDHRSPTSLGSTIKFLNNPTAIEAFAGLTEAVRRGTTQLPNGGATEPEFEEWVLFARSMTPLVTGPAEFVADVAASTRPAPDRVLDIAAGHGLYGIAVARKAPSAHIVALDWPKVLQVAKENARAAGVENRYRFLPGDAFTMDFGSGYDIVLLTNLLHHFTEPECESLLSRIHDAMNPGGRLLTLEFVPNEDRVTPPIAAAFSLIMLATTPGGDAFTVRQHERMLRAAGFTQVEVRDVPHSPQRLIVSTK